MGNLSIFFIQCQAHILLRKEFPVGGKRQRHAVGGWWTSVLFYTQRAKVENTEVWTWACIRTRALPHPSIPPRGVYLQGVDLVELEHESAVGESDVLVEGRLAPRPRVQRLAKKSQSERLVSKSGN